EIILIAEVPYTITTRERYQRFGIRKGNHGFDHQAPEMEAFFLAAGPSFREEEIVNPINSIHLYELMSHLLNIKPAPNDGSLDSLKHLLRYSIDGN
ncbi:MAG: alkaline phosphatase family protein, partial [Balneolaceae bacterium]